MKDQRDVAIKLMGEAADLIGKHRGQQHGPVAGSFTMIGELWTVYLRHVRTVRQHDTIMPEDVLQMMTMVKKARNVYGDRSNRENFVDDIGYVSLAGMLQVGEKEPDDDKINSVGNNIAAALDKDYDPPLPEPIIRNPQPVNVERMTGSKAKGYRGGPVDN